MAFTAHFQVTDRGPYWSLGVEAIFALPEEAEQFAEAFKARWGLVKRWHRLEVPDAVTHQWDFAGNRLEQIALTKEPSEQLLVEAFRAVFDLAESGIIDPREDQDESDRQYELLDTAKAAVRRMFNINVDEPPGASNGNR